jgi:acyl-coenzyme A thioesterase PaaI-like protein
MDTDPAAFPDPLPAAPALPPVPRLSQELHCGCFACGAANPVGLRLQFEVTADGIATATWQPAAAFRSYADRVHGGVLAVLLDSAMVHALFATGVTGVTAELTIRYLHSVAVTTPVEVRGWVKPSRHGVIPCGAELHQAGTLVVRAAAKFMAM